MPESRLRIWFALFVLVVFCLGLAGGILIGRQLPRERPIDLLFWGARDGRPPRAPFETLNNGGRRGGPVRGLLLDRLSRDLDLTADQRATIDAALSASRSRLDALQKDVRDRFDAERRTVREAIRGVLTPEQQQKFDRLERIDRGRRRGAVR